MAAKRANTRPAQYELSTEAGNLLVSAIVCHLSVGKWASILVTFLVSVSKKAENSSLARDGFILAHSSGHHVSRSRHCWSHDIHSKAERWTLALGCPSALARGSSPLKGTPLELDIPSPVTGSGNPHTDKPKGCLLSDSVCSQIDSANLQLLRTPLWHE